MSLFNKISIPAVPQFRNLSTFKFINFICSRNSRESSLENVILDRFYLR